MIQLGGRTILLGGFHDHWARTNADNPALLMAAMNYYHYDFMCLMDGPGETPTKTAIETCCPHMRIYLGLETAWNWGHMVNVHPVKPVDVPPGCTPEEAFAAHNEAFEFVAMAHPAVEARADGLLMLEEVGRLMDKGVIKATQVCLSPQEFEWFARREREGKLTPICSGWDVHGVNPLRNLPPALYTRRRDPAGHLDSGGSCRTLVFAETNDFGAIKAAVLRGDSVVEDLFTGKFLGPSKLVRFLEDSGYRQAISRLDARRDACELTLNGKPVAGERLTMKFSTPGKVHMPGTLQKPEKFDTAADGTLVAPPLPALLDRDMTYLPVVKTEPDGYVRVWAVELHHPVQLDVLPLIGSRGPEIEIHPSAPFAGTWSLKIDGVPGEITGDENKLVVPLPGGDLPSEPLLTHLTARSRSNMARHGDIMLTYAAAGRFDGDWSRIPACDIAEDCLPKIGWACTRPYPGRDVFSAKLQFAWTDRELLVRTEVTDPVHYQVLHGHYMYNGDSIQLALDPLLRREDGVGSFYVFNYCLGPEGPEVFRWHRPDDGLTPGYKAKPYNATLGSRYLEVRERENGLTYELRLPWEEIAPVRPEVGLRMGVYYILFNNNGQGLIDSLYWPRPIPGMWLVPRRWGVLTLV